MKKAVDRARRFLDSRGEWDPFYAASRVRLEARRLIKSHGRFDVSEDEEDASTADFEFTRIPNIGLQFYCDGVLAKVLKRSSDPDMPLPVSSSRKRIGFCNQQRQIVPHPTIKDATPRLSEWNAFYLWDCNEDHYFSRLSLVCPRTGGKSKPDMSFHWIVDIPLLSTARGPIVEFGPESKQQTLIEDVEDIRLPQDDTETGTNEPK